MSSEEYKVIPDPVYGYRRLDPLPSLEKLADFYESSYHELVRLGQRAPDVRRFMEGGEEAERERHWLRTTLYSDIHHVLSKYAPGKRVLDVGCSVGELLSYLKDKGFGVAGIEPSREAAAIAVSRGLSVYSSSFEDFIKRHSPGGLETFDAVTLINVLEHVEDPVHVIKIAREILASKGIICVMVPNDFNEMQLAAQGQTGKEPWWIAIPDHINYFDFRSLRSLLEGTGFEVIYSQANFPMELFLLMGDDYIGNTEMGKICHTKRINFETSISGELRRRLYQALAEVGIGRSCLVFARLK